MPCEGVLFTPLKGKARETADEAQTSVTLGHDKADELARKGANWHSAEFAEIIAQEAKEVRRSFRQLRVPRGRMERYGTNR